MSNLDDFKFIESIKDNEVGVIRLDGTFGREIDGAMIAHEISYLDRVAKVKEIHVHINTVGGVVFDSLSVVSAILSANAEVHGHNDGLCMSAGFHTFLACDILHAYDYAVFMYHEARYTGVKKSELTKSQLESLNSTNESMATLIANRLGKEVSEVAEMLKDESYFQATKFEEKLGVSLDIKSSKKSPNLKSSMSLEEVVAEFESFTNTNLNKEEMSENKIDITGVMAKLDISADESNPIEAVLAKVGVLIASEKKATEKVAELKGDLKVFTDKAAEAYVDALIADEKIKAESKESILEAYLSNPSVVKATFDALPEAKVEETIEGEQGENRADIEAKADAPKLVIEMTKDATPVKMDYLWYSQNASDELKLMMRENPSKYNFLLEQYTGE